MGVQLLGGSDISQGDTITAVGVLRVVTIPSRGGGRGKGEVKRPVGGRPLSPPAR